MAKREERRISLGQITGRWGNLHVKSCKRGEGKASFIGERGEKDPDSAAKKEVTKRRSKKKKEASGLAVKKQRKSKGN